jgi:hypothetical protein
VPDDLVISPRVEVENPPYLTGDYLFMVEAARIENDL